MIPIILEKYILPLNIFWFRHAEDLIVTPFAQVFLMPTLFNINPVTSIFGRSESMKTSVPTSSGAVEYAVDDSFGKKSMNIEHQAQHHVVELL